MEIVQKCALTLTIIGAINWGFVGLLDFNIIASIFGGAEALIPRVIFSLVGLAGLINIILLLTPLDLDKKIVRE